MLEPVYQKGVLVGHKRVFTDKMAELLMKGHAQAANRAGGQFTDEQTINIKTAVVTKTAAEVAQTVRKVSPLIIARASNGSFRADNEGFKFCKWFKNSENGVSHIRDTSQRHNLPAIPPDSPARQPSPPMRPPVTPDPQPTSPPGPPDHWEACLPVYQTSVSSGGQAVMVCVSIIQVDNDGWREAVPPIGIPAGVGALPTKAARPVGIGSPPVDSSLVWAGIQVGFSGYPVHGDGLLEQHG